MWECEDCKKLNADEEGTCWFRKVERNSEEALGSKTVSSIYAKSCSRCGSEKVASNVEILDDTDSSNKRLSLTVDTNPYALFFKGNVKVEMRAKVCCDCGYAELCATEPQRLWNAYQQAMNAR